MLAVTGNLPKSCPDSGVQEWPRCTDTHGSASTTAGPHPVGSPIRLLTFTWLTGICKFALSALEMHFADVHRIYTVLHWMAVLHFILSGLSSNRWATHSFYHQRFYLQIWCQDSSQTSAPTDFLRYQLIPVEEELASVGKALSTKLEKEQG